MESLVTYKRHPSVVEDVSWVKFWEAARQGIFLYVGVGVGVGVGVWSVGVCMYIIQHIQTHMVIIQHIQTHMVNTQWIHMVSMLTFENFGTRAKRIFFSHELTLNNFFSLHMVSMLTFENFGTQATRICAHTSSPSIFLFIYVYIIYILYICIHMVKCWLFFSLVGTRAPPQFLRQ